jgi:hypothetical protein
MVDLQLGAPGGVQKNKRVFSAPGVRRGKKRLQVSIISSKLERSVTAVIKRSDQTHSMTKKPYALFRGGPETLPSDS